MSHSLLRHPVRPCNAQLIDVPACVLPPTTGAYDVPQGAVFITIPSTHPGPSIFWAQPVVWPATQVNNRLPNWNRSPPATVQAWHESHRQCFRRKTPNFWQCLGKKHIHMQFDERTCTSSWTERQTNASTCVHVGLLKLFSPVMW